MRFVVICLLILALMFAGHCIYYRTKADRLLKEATAMMPTRPEEAYEKFKPALQLNDTLALGKIRQTSERFRGELAQRVRLELEMAPPTAEAYLHAGAAVNVLKTLDQTHGVPTQEQIETITRAASEAMPVIRDRGTLSAWQAMITFFERCRENEWIQPGVIDDLDDWMAQVRRVPLRPLGLREVREQCVNQFALGLKALGLSTSASSGAFVAPAPDRLTNQQLISAEAAFNNAQNALRVFPRLFQEKDLPPELVGLEAKLCYNKAAIKTAHIQDYGDAARRSGTGYIAELLIEPNRMVVPTPQELFGAFTQGALGDFMQAQKLFPTVPGMSVDFRQAYTALATLGEALLASATGGNPGNLPAQAKSIGARAGGKAQSIAQTMNRSGRICIIVEVP